MALYPASLPSLYVQCLVKKLGLGRSMFRVQEMDQSERGEDTLSKSLIPQLTMLAALRTLGLTVLLATSVFGRRMLHGGDPALNATFVAGVRHSIDGANRCAGTLIAPRLVLTAAHCLFTQLHAPCVSVLTCAVRLDWRSGRQRHSPWRADCGHSERRASQLYVRCAQLVDYERLWRACPRIAIELSPDRARI